MARLNNQRHEKRRRHLCGPPGALLALLVLCAQLAIPVLHALGNEGTQAPRHAHEVTSAGKPALDGGRVPCSDHHDTAACPVCQSLQRSRHSVVAQSLVALAFDAPRLVVPASGAIPALAAVRTGCAPRAPPFFF